MSSLDINKYVGAILVTLLMIWVIGMIGDALVHPGKPHAPAMVAGDGKAPAPKKAKAPAAAAPAGQPTIAALLAKASAADGKKVVKKCAACHSLTDGGKNKIGPNLWNVVNAPKAGKDGFKYSSALRDKGGKWTYEDLNAFLASLALQVDLVRQLAQVGSRGRGEPLEQGRGDGHDLRPGERSLGGHVHREVGAL